MWEGVGPFPYGYATGRTRGFDPTELSIVHCKLSIVLPLPFFELILNF
jgi:hypothetical protein